MEDKKTNRNIWLPGAAGFVAGVATTLVAGALLMGGMMAMMGGGMMGGDFCRPNSLHNPGAEPAAQGEGLG